MFRNHLIMAFRNLRRYKYHSLINIFGLAIGIACTFVISLFLREETSFDQYHTNAENIYRVAHKRALDGSFREMATTPLFLAEKLKTDFASVDKVVRFMRESFGSIKVDNELFLETRFCFVDETLRDVFDIPLVNGNPDDILSAPNNMILSESMAAKYFKEENPVGKTLIWSNWNREYEYQITGVFEDIPENSHFQFDFFVPYDAEVNLWKTMHGEDWHYSGAWTYVQMAPGSTPADLESQLNSFAGSSLPAPLNTSTEFYLQALTDIHLQSNLSGEVQANGNITTVYIFTVIALLILLISAINFINLSTARALTRSKEVGVRKTLGAYQSNLIRQFLTESVLVGVIASMVAILLSYLALPLFNQLAEKQISLEGTGGLVNLLTIPATGALVGLIAGLYPALFLSGFNPVKALKTTVYAGKDKGLFLRSGLVTLQFSISIILLIGIGTITKQLRYLKNKELGFDKEQVVFVNGYDWRQYETLKTQLEAIPGVLDVTGGSSVPGTQNATPIVRMTRLDQNSDEDRLEVHLGSIDTDYLELLNLQLSEGRNFSRELTSDRAESILVNEAFIRQAGITDNPVGQKVAQYDMMGAYTNTKTIVGVLEDFHMESLHGDIKPIVYNLNPQNQFNAILKVSPEAFTETMDRIREAATAIANGNQVDIYFLDQDIATLYSKEDRLSNIISLFTGLAIFISCLGLLGLASFTTARKTKEIGIRKALGASLFSLLALLTKHLTRLVLIAFLLGAPVAWLALDSWLDNFAYRANPGLMIYVFVALATILITWLTVGYQSFKAAITNPVKSLRNE